MREVWYVMEDGTAGDPRQISPDAKGILKHSDGRKVAYAPHGPRTRGVDIDPGDQAAGVPSQAKQMKPAKPKGGGYKTRQSKAE